MGCCTGAKFHNWCADYDIVYVDGEGKEYCIFHAPAECKFVEKYVDGVGEKPELISGEKFNELVFTRIQGVIDAGEDEEQDKWDFVSWNPRCNFAGTIFFVDISFAEFSVKEGKDLPPINFRSSQFCSCVFFSACRFRGDVYFGQMQFLGSVNFEHSQFFGQTDFRFILFCDSVDFGFIKFFDNTSFTSIQFCGSTSFFKSEFRGIVNFENSQFCGDVVFNETIFLNSAYFLKAESKKQFTLTESFFKKKLSFDNMEFKGPAYFDNATFEETVSFVRSIFHDYSNFEKAKFLKEAIFKHALFKEWTYFRNVTFTGKTSFAGTISKEKILIEATDLSNMPFAETNIESFKFIECEWDKGEDGINLVYDEANQDELETKNSALEEIYRRLKKVARENADEEQTSAWHYKEKEMKKREADSAFFFPAIITTFLTFIAFLICCGLLESTAPYYSLIVLIPTALAIPFLLIQNQYKKFKLKYKDVQKSKNWFSKVYLNIYYWISGYGENPLRAGVLLVVLILLPFLISFFIGFKGGADWVKHAMWYMPLLKVNFPKSASFEGIQYFWKGVSISLITIQAALLAFALRNKLRR